MTDEQQWMSDGSIAELRRQIAAGARPRGVKLVRALLATIEKKDGGRAPLPEDLMDRVRAFAIEQGEYPSQSVEFLVRLGLARARELLGEKEIDDFNRWYKGRLVEEDPA